MPAQVEANDLGLSVHLIIILVVLMAANQIIGTGYGSWKSGFDKGLFDKGLFFRGVEKVFLLLIGYGAIALAVHFAADYVPKAEYLSGILLEPIARYFTKVCESLKQLLNEPTRTEPPAVPQEQMGSDVAQEDMPAE